MLCDGSSVGVRPVSPHAEDFLDSSRTQGSLTFFHDEQSETIVDLPAPSSIPLGPSSGSNFSARFDGLREIQIVELGPSRWRRNLRWAAKALFWAWKNPTSNTKMPRMPLVAF